MWSPLKLQDESFAAKNAVVQVTRTLPFGNLRTTHCTRNNCKGLTADDPLSPWPWNAASGEETIWNIGISYNSTPNTFLSHNGLPLCDKSVKNGPVKLKRTKARASYYPNGVATFQILLCSGDVQQNPGPATRRTGSQQTASENPANAARVSTTACPQCGKTVRRKQKRFLCCVCQDLHHARCTGTCFNLKFFRGDSPEIWTCPKCTLSLLPFHGQSDRQFDEDPTITSSEDESARLCCCGLEN